MSFFDLLQKVLVRFLLNTIARLRATSKPTKIVSNLHQQLNHIGFVL